MKGNRIAHLAVVSGILLMWLSACATSDADLPSGEAEVGLVEGPEDLVTATADGRDTGGEAEVGLIETPLDSDIMEAEDVDAQMPPSPPIGTPYQMGDIPFQVGDVIRAGDLVMSVLGWSTSPTRELRTADPGNVYVMTDFVLINRGEQLLDIHIFLMVLLDENGVIYRLPGKIMDAFDLSLNPGEQVRGLIPIEVPESSRGLQFVYQPYGEEAEVDIVVDLGPEPIALDFPEELHILETHVHSIGEEISYGEVTVTVLGWRLSQGNENGRPAEGTKLVVVDALIVNKGSEALKRPHWNIFLRDTDLNRYEYDSRFWHSPRSVVTTIVPGEPMRLDVVFQVPETVNEFYLIYDDENADDEVNELYVDLPSEPVTAEVPVGASVFGDEIHAIGQEIGHGDLTLAVLGWSKSTGDDIQQPEEGNVYVIVDVLIVNHGETVNVPKRHMKLFDAELREYRHVMGSRLPFPWPLNFDDIGRGERLRGQVAFEVPSDSSDHIFVVELSSSEGGQVAVSLGAQPATFDPPSKLLAPNPNAFRVGETIKLGDLELLVVSCAESFGRLGVEPKAGYKFFIVEVSLTNLGSKSVDSDSSMYQPQIRDATGYRFEINPFLYLNGQSNYRALQDPIAAGEQVHAFLFYEVPIESSGFVLLFDPKWIVGDDGGDGVSIDLGVE